MPVSSKSVFILNVCAAFSQGSTSIASGSTCELAGSTCADPVHACAAFSGCFQRHAIVVPSRLLGPAGWPDTAGKTRATGSFGSWRSLLRLLWWSSTGELALLCRGAGTGELARIPLCASFATSEGVAEGPGNASRPLRMLESEARRAVMTSLSALCREARAASLGDRPMAGAGDAAKVAWANEVCATGEA